MRRDDDAAATVAVDDGDGDDGRLESWFWVVLGVAHFDCDG